MLDYTDIESKIEDANNALDSLYNLIHSQYDDIFQGEDAEKYKKMLQNIKEADRCLGEVSDINAVLSDKYEEAINRFNERLDRKYGKAKDR